MNHAIMKRKFASTDGEDEITMLEPVFPSYEAADAYLKENKLLRLSDTEQHIIVLVQFIAQ